MAQWITSIVHDELQSRVEISLSHDVEHFRPERVIAFEQVRRVEYTWTSKDAGSMEGLLGAEELTDEDHFHYLIETDQRGIEIVASERAMIHAI